MGLRDAARQDTTPAQDTRPPGYVMDMGGPAVYAELMHTTLTTAINDADWNIVRQISTDPWVLGDDRDRAAGALAGAGVTGYEKRPGSERYGRPPKTAAPEAPESDGRVIGREPPGRELEVTTAVQGTIAPAKPRVVQGTPLHLTPEQHAILLRGINPVRVSKDGGQSHLEAWDVRRTLTRIFGFGGWNEQTLELRQIHESIKPKPGASDRFQYTIVYLAQVRLTIYNQDGTVGAFYEDAATGDGINMPSYQKAADFAVKTALSQALKRCAVNLGDQFGLSLYNKGSYDPQVNVTLVGPVIEGGDVVEAAVQSDRVHGEEQPVVEDPGEDSGPTGLPDANELRDEALERRTSSARLRQIYQMVKPRGGDHPEMATILVTNENGDEEKLAALVYRQIDMRKKEGEQ